MTAKLTLDEKIMLAIPTMTDEQLAMTKNFIRAEERKRGTFRRTARKAQPEVLVTQTTQSPEHDPAFVVK